MSDAAAASPKLYGPLASWWPLLSPPEEYIEEAEIYRRLLADAGIRAGALLELGCGGGSNASHLKRHFTVTLSDLSPDMLAVSRALNPECEHLEGDMRSLRLGRSFDAVFLHDAVAYMTTEADLARAIETAFAHCRPGGVALFAPDYVREKFHPPATDCGGADAPDGRGLRYLEWCWDPDPDDTTYVVDYAYLLRDARGETRVVHDRHLEGVFPRATWLRLLGEAGFRAQCVPIEHSEVDPCTLEVFVGHRP